MSHPAAMTDSNVETGFDVFLSYNRKDQSAVVALARKLQAQGFKVWLDVWELRPGHPWQEALERIIETTRAAVVLVGMDGLGPWQDREMRGCLSEFVNRGLPVIPVLLPNCPVIPKLPFFLQQFTWVDFRDGREAERFERLLWGITGKKPPGFDEPITPPRKSRWSVSWLTTGLIVLALAGGGTYAWHLLGRLPTLSEPEMVTLAGGTFQIGADRGSDPEAQDDEQPRQVMVKPFRIGKLEVTQDQWRQVMGSNPSHFPRCGGDCPVENVSYEDVQRFIEELNRRTGKRYRLPTEMEWEYACRSGGEAQKYCGGDEVDALGWHGDNSGGETHPVAGKSPNGLALHDLSGNVWEWTCSAYSAHYDGNEAKCADSGNSHVIRGGSWGVRPVLLRSATRNWLKLNDRYSSLGFRLAQD